MISILFKTIYYSGFLSASYVLSFSSRQNQWSHTAEGIIFRCNSKLVLKNDAFVSKSDAKKALFIPHFQTFIKQKTTFIPKPHPLTQINLQQIKQITYTFGQIKNILNRINNLESQCQKLSSKSKSTKEQSPNCAITTLNQTTNVIKSEYRILVLKA